MHTDVFAEMVIGTGRGQRRTVTTRQLPGEGVYEFVVMDEIQRRQFGLEQSDGLRLYRAYHEHTQRYSKTLRQEIQVMVVGYPS